MGDGAGSFFALALRARYLIFRQLVSHMSGNARVLNVLASTMGDDTHKLTNEQFKEIISSSSDASYHFHDLMMVAALAGDVFMQQAAREYPTNRYIGTHPGFVNTELFATLMGSSSLRWISLHLLRLSVTEEQAGETQAQILSCPNAMGFRNPSFFNAWLEGRRTLSASYDP